MKSQSAMEYLMTYGWVILVIAVVLGVLFQLGVFGSANLTPKAQPGACQVQKTSASISLEGMCQGLEPQYVGSFGASAQTYMLASLDSALMTPGSLSRLTISAWVYEQQNSDCEVGVAVLGPLSGGIASDWVYRFGVGGGGWSSPNPNEVLLEIFSPSGPWQTNMFSGPSVPYDSWTNIAATYNGAVVNFYINGQPSGSTGYSSPMQPGASNTVMIIGANPNSGCANSFPGYVSNLQVYNSSLSSSELLSLYQQGIGGAPIKPQNIVGWWPLNGNANDYSGSSDNGQDNGAGYVGSWTNGYIAP